MVDLATVAIIIVGAVGIIVLISLFEFSDATRHPGRRKDFKHLAEVEAALKKDYEIMYSANLAKAKQGYEDELVKLKHQYSGSSKPKHGFEGEFIRSGLEGIATWCKGMMAVRAVASEKDFHVQTLKFELMKSVLSIYFLQGTEEYNSYSKILDETRSLLLQVFRGVRDASFGK